MGIDSEKPVEYLVVDTTAFIQNAPLQVSNSFFNYYLGRLSALRPKSIVTEGEHVIFGYRYSLYVYFITV